MSGIFSGNETQKTQRIIMLLDVSDRPLYNTPQIAIMAGVKDSIARDTLVAANCIERERTGGSKKLRSKESNNTVRKTFDAVIEPKKEGNVPIKCRLCKYADKVKRITLFGNKATTSGCIILEERAKKMGF